MHYSNPEEIKIEIEKLRAHGHKYLEYETIHNKVTILLCA
jgi:hypothetical protein